MRRVGVRDEAPLRAAGASFPDVSYVDPHLDIIDAHGVPKTNLRTSSLAKDDM
jgi:hypothetical protein